MKYMLVTIAFTVYLTGFLVSGQYFGPQFDISGSYNGFGLNSLTGDLGGPTAFGGGSLQARDPRQNRGPVVFPPSPENVPNESSGVIIGASGYGFVPPQNQVRSKI